MILTYAVILERVSMALGEAQRLHKDAPTPEHAALVKELSDSVEHLERLVGLMHMPRERRGLSK